MKQSNAIDLEEFTDTITLMNTKLLAIAALVILLLGAGGLYFLSQNKPQTQDTTNKAATESEKSSGKSLMDLISLGQNQRCTFSTANEGGSTEGTFYVSQGNVRGDFKVKTSQGKESQMSMIRSGDTNYMWGSDLQTGIKMKLSLEDLSKNTQANQYSSVDPSAKADYNCMPWTVDSSLFTPPSNVKFTDLSSMMDKMQGPTGTQTGSGSNPCDQITDPEDKTACENAMQQ